MASRPPTQDGPQRTERCSLYHVSPCNDGSGCRYTDSGKRYKLVAKPTEVRIIPGYPNLEHEDMGMMANFEVI
jgi:hypothetical protein